jgi:hypothetical protein
LFLVGSAEDSLGLGQLVAVGTVRGEKILLDGNTPLLIREEANTNAIRAVFLEVFELRMDRYGVGQTIGLADVDPVVARPAIGAIFIGAPRYEIYGRNRFEPRLQGPHLEVVILAGFPAESDASVSHESAAIRDVEALIPRTWAP